LAIGAGVVASVGTILPPIFAGTFAELLHAASGSGVCILAGVAVAAAGIVFVGLAGMSKEKELSAEQKTQGVAEYNFPLGLALALFSGLMSCGMPLGIRHGDTIKALTEQLEPHSSVTWRGLPVLVVVLAGGALVNIGYCALLNLKNRSASNYGDRGAPLVSNYALAAAAGFIWYLQFLFLTIGDGYLAKFAFAGFSILMSSMILFSTIFGILLKEWQGTSAKTRGLLALGLAVLLASVIVIGFGKYLDSKAAAASPGQSERPTANQKSNS
jgi:L-rhamnose-H+ transport protein